MTLSGNIAPAWLVEARRRFGEREEVFEYVDSPYSLWTNLRDVFKRAYEYPYTEADIRSIYEYADWSCRQPRGATAEDDLLTCVAVCFFERLPEIDAAVKDLPRWFKLSEIMAMSETLSYRLGDAGFERLLEAYPKTQRAKMSKTRPTGRRPT
ncbi:hypothetical protein [Haloferula rosea]|uniref:Uncharacterized protein n=1 Tax=Haloferula rosea TaxID=490093 RepID=A0A934RI59_9BACT|nr:hypothetical protein [Haloferula rosea]MBK1828735.1 hypothetical protein [Haloferula rosea]